MYQAQKQGKDGPLNAQNQGTDENTHQNYTMLWNDSKQGRQEDYLTSEGYTADIQCTLGYSSRFSFLLLFHSRAAYK